jgi:hypothetical protein
MPPGPVNEDGLVFGRIFADFLHTIYQTEVDVKTTGENKEVEDKE